MRLSRVHSPLAALPSSVARNAESSAFPGGLLAATALMAACWLGCPLPAQAAQQALRGHVPPVAKRLAPIGRLEGGRRLDLAIGLPLRNREKLTNLLQEMYQPSSANFRRYLTADQFASSFGPSQEDYQAVADFAKSHGLMVKGTHPNRTLLDVSGSVADIEKAFHIQMRVYQHPVQARTFFAPDVEPSLDLDTPVLAISGLDNYARPRPLMHRLGAPFQPQARPLRPPGGGSGYSGPFEGADFLAAYAAGVMQDGAGQSVGLFELSGYDPDDITAYEDENGMSYVNVENILVDGFDGDDANTDFAIEATGDIEMAISMAPGLNSVLVYEGPPPLDDEGGPGTNYIQDAGTTAQINDVLNRMATDDLAKQLSCSYIMDINTSTVQIFQQFAAQGQSFFQGAGDSGAYAGAIDEPADDPYITIVGGTTLTTAATSEGGAWDSETVWLTPAGYDDSFGIPIATPLEGTGGGVSLTYGIPAWQQGISMSANQGSTTMRNLPDVALVADNINIYWGSDYYDGILAGDQEVSGTSLATPLWAGFMALVNQAAAAMGQPPIGFANPALYAIGKSTNYHSCFHDITNGNNFNTSSPGKYAATPGFDLCSGWGTIIGSNLLQALLAPPSEYLVIAPPLGFTSSGPGGGPFTATSQTYTLTNIGSKELNWSLANTSLWLNVSSAGGALNRHAAATLTISLNAAATNFLIGNYSGNVSILDVTDGTTQNRQFDLYVGNGGFETGDFTDWNFVGTSDLDFVLCGDDADVAGTNVLVGTDDWQFVHSGLYGAYLGESSPDGSLSDGSLSQAVATIPGQEYLVSCWLTSFAYQGSTIPNDFAVKWNGVTLYAQTNLDAFGWTNLQFVVPATADRTTLEFDFSNVQSAFGFDDVSVQTAPAPVLQSVTLADGVLTFTWSGMAGLSYQVQSAGNLSNPNWTNVGAAVTAAGDLVSASESFSKASPQQFYRVALLPSP
ncbi:MAG: protease pro-enzyme activation domain-containing protein [Verrucomicrobiota bacterium]